MSPLTRASRRIPVRLWIRLMLGQWLVQISAAIIGAGSFAFAHFVSAGPDDPPPPLVAGIILIGCIPVILVGVGRARRVLYMLRTAPLVDSRLRDPIGEQKDLALEGIIGAPSIDGNKLTLGERPMIAHLFLLPLVALAGVVALAAA